MVFYKPRSPVFLIGLSYGKGNFFYTFQRIPHGYPHPTGTKHFYIPFIIPECRHFRYGNFQFFGRPQQCVLF